MTELNQFMLYSRNTGVSHEDDEIDNYVNDLRKIDEYDEVLKFIQEHFGEVESGKIYDYPELNKQICINLKEDAIEFCAAKNRKQFFGKGWKIINKE